MPRQLVRSFVDQDLHRRFRAQFPMHGALSWLMETAMAEVLAITDGTPDLEDLVKQSIRQTLLRNKRAGLLNRESNGNREPEPLRPTAGKPFSHPVTVQAIQQSDQQDD